MSGSSRAGDARRPRLLLLGQTLPFPPDSGVNIRMYNVLRLLARTFDVTALFFYRRSERRNAADVASSLEGLRPFASAEAFPIPQEHSRPRFVWDHLRSSLIRRPYMWYGLESAAYRARVQALVASDTFDLAQIDSLDLACYLPALASIPVVCVHHNIESDLLRRRALAESSRWRRSYVEMQARLLEALEREWCNKVALNVTVSSVDLDGFRALAPRARYVCIPNGVDIDAFRPEPGRNAGIVSLGGTNWFPNLDAIEYFCADVLPRVRAAVPGAPVTWVGRASPAERERYRTEHGVTLTGYVDDVRPHVRDAACFVVPLRVGGGTRLKILDAWAMGKAIVSTSIGCEGLHAVDGQNMLISDTPEGFADAVTQVLTDPELRDRLSRAGRETAEREYSWEVIGRAIEAEYHGLLRPASAGAAA